MNDETEIRHGLSIFDDTFKSYRNNLNAELVEIINDLRKAVESPEFCIFIASFCKNGDLLSQWRGYNASYSLGIQWDWLIQNANEQGFDLIPIAYPSGRQLEVVQQKLKLMTRYVEEEVASGRATLRQAVLKWWTHMLVVMAALKNETFYEEDEYRLVKACYNWPKHVQTRATAAGLVPYVPVRFDVKIINNKRFHPGNYGIEEVILKPRMPDQQCAALDALFASQSMRPFIRKSGIPLRQS